MNNDNVGGNNADDGKDDDPGVAADDVCNHTDKGTDNDDDGDSSAANEQ